MLKKALAERDEALATMNMLAVELAVCVAERGAATGEQSEELQKQGDVLADQLEAAIADLEDKQLTVAFWRAVARGIQSLG